MNYRMWLPKVPRPIYVTSRTAAVMLAARTAGAVVQEWSEAERTWIAIG